MFLRHSATNFIVLWLVSLTQRAQVVRSFAVCRRPLFSMAPTRSSSRRLLSSKEDEVAEKISKVSPKKKVSKVKATTNAATKTTTKSPKGSTKAETTKKQRSPKGSDSEESLKKKAPKHQVITTRDPIPKLWNDDLARQNDSYTFKIATWNVAGLRGLLTKNPSALQDLCQKHDLDVLCLQETKLQESHVTDIKLNLTQHHPVGYDAYYSCSKARKGYSGTAVFVKQQKKTKQQTTLDGFFQTKTSEKKQSTKFIPANFDQSLLSPTEVSFDMGVEKHDQEGRMVVVKFPLFTLVNVYVPNSGQKLERLSYRTEEWDVDFLKFMQSQPNAMWCGDLNVAHTNLEVWNDGAKHLATQAGVTEQERASFTQQLESGFIDVFRHLHPKAAGHYTYWSQRAGNREPNKGLRLDYFVCNPGLLDDSSKIIVRDSYMDTEQLGSDHCPAILEMEIKNRS